MEQTVSFCHHKVVQRLSQQCLQDGFRNINCDILERVRLVSSHHWGVKWWMRWETPRGRISWMILPIVSTPGQRCHVYLLWGYELMVTASAFLHSKMLVGEQNPMSSVAELQTSELPFTVGGSDDDLPRPLPRGLRSQWFSIPVCRLFSLLPQPPFSTRYCGFFVCPCCVMALHKWLSLSLGLCSLLF